ncbi:MAG: alpha/beta hydrolase fold domain-containing protein, partial [Pseudomonadota bacterium]
MTTPLSYLDRQLKFGTILPDFQAWLDWMATQSDGATWTQHATGPDARQVVEITAGAGVPDAPTLFFIHGGYWRAQDIARYRFVARGAAALGGAVALAEYRLMPQVTLTDLIEDAVAALQTTAS